MPIIDYKLFNPLIKFKPEKNHASLDQIDLNKKKKIDFKTAINEYIANEFRKIIFNNCKEDKEADNIAATIVNVPKLPGNKEESASFLEYVRQLTKGLTNVIVIASNKTQTMAMKI